MACKFMSISKIKSLTTFYTSTTNNNTSYILTNLIIILFLYYNFFKSKYPFLNYDLFYYRVYICLNSTLNQVRATKIWHRFN